MDDRVAAVAWMALLHGCTTSHRWTPDAVSQPCMEDRDVTFFVVADGADPAGSSDTRPAFVTRIASALASGDLDLDGRPETSGRTVRIAVTSSSVAGPGCGPTAASDGHLTTCNASFGALMTTASTGWQSELACRMTPPGYETCIPQTFEAALLGLSPEVSVIDLSPRRGLGDNENRALLATTGPLVVFLMAGDWRDDCSRPIDEGAAPAACPPFSDRPCCEENLPPVSRTSTGLRAALAGRDTIFVALGDHPSFDPARAGPELIDTLLRDGFESRCGSSVRIGYPHRRMVELARELHPDMYLEPLCSIPDDRSVVPALLREIGQRACR